MLCLEPPPRSPQVSVKQQRVTSTDCPTPPVSKLDFPIYKARPGTELIFIWCKQGASRNQQDSPGAQLPSQRVHYFILFYTKTESPSLFSAPERKNWLKKQWESPKAKPFSTQTFASPSFFLSWTPNETDVPRRVTFLSLHMFGRELTLLSFYSCGLSAVIRGNIRQRGNASSSDALTSKVG